MTDNSFEANDSLRLLIRRNPELLMQLRRFGISLGFGNNTVAEVCEKANIDTDTFLAIANYTVGHAWRHFHVDPATLLVYLKNAHVYFLDYALPSIRRKLIEALPMAEPNSLALLMLRYFDDYSEEVRLHMEFENRHVFPYIQNLLEGIPGEFAIAELEARHESITPKLNELKEFFICHYSGEGNGDLLNSALYDIISTERELRDHCGIEDDILVPAARTLEPEAKPSTAQKATVNTTAELTARENEIVRCIARGLSTKEIASALYLSTHTVTTHRRNICAKLDIHSAPALTVYAIIHKLVDISEIKVQ